MNRRQFLGRLGGGLGSLALARLLDDEGLLAPARADHRSPDWQPRARAVIQLFMSGAASQCDLFDYKPLLIERAGEPFDPGGRVELFQSDPGRVMPSPGSGAGTGSAGGG